MIITCNIFRGKLTTNYKVQEALNGVELIEIYKMNQSKKILFCTYECSIEDTL